MPALAAVLTRAERAETLQILGVPIGMPSSSRIVDDDLNAHCSAHASRYSSCLDKSDLDLGE